MRRVASGFIKSFQFEARFKPRRRRDPAKTRGASSASQNLRGRNISLDCGEAGILEADPAVARTRQTTLMTIRKYETFVDICVITNSPANLRAVLKKWNLPATRVCEFKGPLDETEPYALVWKHREIFAEALESDASYTMFMYLEDDTDVSWPAIKSWAQDTEVLEPLGFMRGLIRTEFHPDDGRAALMDVMDRVNISTWTRTLEVKVPKAKRCQIASRPDGYWSLKEAPANCQHSHYIGLKEPYMGMWLASRTQLKRFRASPYWDKSGALAAEKPDDIGFGLGQWGVPERSTGMLQLLDVPAGFWSASVVPYDPDLHMLLPISSIEHERNAYSVRPELRDAKIAVDDVFFV